MGMLHRHFATVEQVAAEKVAPVSVKKEEFSSPVVNEGEDIVSTEEAVKPDVAEVKKTRGRRKSK